MGFFKYVSPCLEFGKKPGEANGSNNYIPITSRSASLIIFAILNGSNNYIPITLISVNKLQKE